jgi:hypothetical protein
MRPPSYIRFSLLYSVRSRLLLFTAVYLVLELTAATQRVTGPYHVHFSLLRSGMGDRLFLFLLRRSSRGDGEIPSSLIYFYHGHDWRRCDKRNLVLISFFRVAHALTVGLAVAPAEISFICSFCLASHCIDVHVLVPNVLHDFDNACIIYLENLIYNTNRCSPSP